MQQPTLLALKRSPNGATSKLQIAWTPCCLAKTIKERYMEQWVGNTAHQTRHARERLRFCGETARLLNNWRALLGGDLRTQTRIYTKPCLRSSQSHRGDIYRHQWHCADQPIQTYKQHSTHQGASQLSLSLETCRCLDYWGKVMGMKDLTDLLEAGPAPPPYY